MNNSTRSQMTDWEIRVPKPRPNGEPGTGGRKEACPTIPSHHVIRKHPRRAGAPKNRQISVRPGIMPGDGVEGPSKYTRYMYNDDPLWQRGPHTRTSQVTKVTHTPPEVMRVVSRHVRACLDMPGHGGHGCLACENIYALETSTGADCENMRSAKIILSPYDRTLLSGYSCATG